MNLIELVRRLFGKIFGQRTQRDMCENVTHKQRYESTGTINFDAVFAGALANKAVNDCNMTITDASDGESRRSVFIASVLEPVWAKIKKNVAQALGKGGKFLIPYVVGDRVYVAAIDQDRCAINQVDGDGQITSMAVIAEVTQVRERTYQRIIDYTLSNRVMTIVTKFIDDHGDVVSADVVPEWTSITPEIAIGNVDRMLVGFLKSPKDSRKENDVYGVPITYGAENTVRQIHDCLHDYEEEFKLKRPFVAADEFLFGKDNKLPSNGLFKKFNGGGGLNSETLWEVFDPAFRDSSYGNRCMSLFALLEKEVGTSRGILTEQASYGATATEIKSANHDTFCLVSDIRKNIQHCIEDLAYAIDVYAEFFGLTPAGAAGDYKVTFDWDMTLAESSAETFDQLSELESRGLVSGARLNSWVTGQRMEDAQAEIDAINEAKTRAAATMLTPEDLEPSEV